jgi:hypothetical protein
LGQLETSWAGVFSDSRNRDYLLPASSAMVSGLESSYDTPPSNRTTGLIGVSGTANTDGVTLFRVALECLTCDPKPSVSYAAPSTEKTGAAPPMSDSVAASLQQGQFYRYHVRAYNIFGIEAVVSSMQFGVDATPPTITDVSLARHGERGLAVHHLNDLSRLTLLFRAFDTESGLRHLEWDLYAHTSEKSSALEESPLIKSASLSVVTADNATSCADAHGDCICNAVQCSPRDYELSLSGLSQLVDSGVHDRHQQRFTFVILATNRAGLTQSTRFELIVDLTPPDISAAAVDEIATQAGPDVDYQSSLQLMFRFSGFTDAESGIVGYLFHVSETCSQRGQVMALDDPGLANYTRARSSAPTATVTLPGIGHYVVSVVALNGALETSPVVCSDGVVVDFTPPRIENVRVAHLATRPGRVRADSNGAVWMINADATRTLVESQGEDCAAGASATMTDAQLAIFPVAEPNVTIVMAAACQRPAFRPLFYLGSETVLNVSWTSPDEAAGIHDFRIGLATPAALAGASALTDVPATVFAYRSTTRAPHVLLPYDAAPDGTEAVLLIEAIKKSKLRSVVAIGPFVVTSRHPRWPDAGALQLDRPNLNALRVSWPAVSVDGLTGDAAGFSYYVGVGAPNDRRKDRLVAFTSFTEMWIALGGDTDAPGAGLCRQPQENRACAVIPTDRLCGLGAFVIAVYACTGAQLCTAPLLSAPQPAVPAAAPQAGIVADGFLDFDLESPLRNMDQLEVLYVRETETRRADADASAQLSLLGLLVRWRHFDLDASNVTYHVAIGSSPGLTDIVSFKPVTRASAIGVGEWHAAYVRVDLTQGETYFSTIRAHNDAGVVVGSSDGITTYADGTRLPLVVHEGPVCDHRSNVTNLLAEAKDDVLAGISLRASADAAQVLSLNVPLHPGLTYQLTLLLSTLADVEYALVEVEVGTLGTIVRISDPLDENIASCCCHVPEPCSDAERVGHMLRGQCVCAADAGTEEIGSRVELEEDSDGGARMSLYFVATEVVTAVRLRLYSSAEEATLSVVPLALSHCAADSDLIRLGISGDATADAVQAWWAWPAIHNDAENNTLVMLVTHFEWAIALVQSGTADIVAALDNATFVQEYTAVGPTHRAATRGPLALPAGTRALAEAMPGHASLVVLVRPCHAFGCLLPSHAAPIFLACGDPQAGLIDLHYIQNVPPQATSDVQLRLEKFVYAVPPVFYRWTIAHHADGAGPLLAWQGVPGRAVKNASDGLINIIQTVAVNMSHFDSQIVYVVVQAFAADGSQGMAASVAQASAPLPTAFRVGVLDVLTEAATGATIMSQDLPFTSSASSLAATWLEQWPLYIADHFDWSVGTVRSFDHDCASGQRASGTLACGRTFDRFAVAAGLALTNDVTYYFCIRAGPVTLQNLGNQGVERPQPDTSCSSGVTVDTLAPTAGTVLLGHAAVAQAGVGTFPSTWLQFHSSQEALALRWYDFEDVVPIAKTEQAYVSGIRRYEVSLGSAPGLSDVYGPVSVGGGTTHLMLRHLTLVNGRPVTATVVAVDHVGLTTAVTSAPVLIDATPPETGEVHAELRADDTGQERAALLDVAWPGFFDSESGLAQCLLLVGTRYGHSDLFGPMTVKASMTTATLPVAFGREGQHFVVTVTCQNRAGLTSSASSPELVLMTRGPAAGNVFDGPAAGEDVSFQQSTSELHASWAGFVDVAGGFGGVAAYAVGLGTEPGLDDVMSLHDVGHVQAAHLRDLVLTAGKTYYAVVQACNTLQLCTTVSSDGVTVDNSAPIAGVVVDGTRSVDIDAQAYTPGISAGWAGFHDVHSGIQEYQWCIGTAAGPRCDVLNMTSVGRATRAISTRVSLPEDGTPLFVTVEAVNGAGLTVQASSDGIALDRTPPEIVTRPYFVPISKLVAAPVVAGVEEHQLSRSRLEARWAFHERAGGPLRFFYTIDTHTEGAAVAQWMPALEDGLSLSGLSLDDGATYYLSVTACNEAELCTTVQGEKALTVDASPPSTGIIVDELEWSTSSVSLQWSGFTDPETNVVQYEVTIGTSFHGGDVLPPVRLSSATTGGTHGGAAAAAQFETAKPLAMGQALFIAVRAFNAVGLASQLVVAEARTQRSSQSLSSGVLQVILHQCESVYCDQRCTCGPRGVCQLSVVGNCNARLGQDRELSVTVLDGAENEDIAVQTDTTVLAGHWTGVSSGYRVTYMAAQKGRNPGFGIFEAGAPELITWLEAGDSDHGVVTLPEGFELEYGQTYVFLVRVWNSFDTYEQFESDGVFVEARPPQHAGAEIREVVPERDVDVDETMDASTLAFAWSGVFRDDGLGLQYYEWMLGSVPGASDLGGPTRVEPGTTFAVVTNLSLRPGHRYYATVRTTNAAGLSTFRFSDGMVVDLTPPEVGTVSDGPGPSDIDVQGSGERLEATWHGFVDLESAIAAYEVAVGTIDDAAGIIPFADVGLNTTLSIPAQLVEGETYVVLVRARNSMGHVSGIARSDGVRVDLTPPVVGQCVLAAGGAGQVLRDGTFAANFSAEGSDWVQSGDVRIIKNAHVGHEELSARVAPLGRIFQRVDLVVGGTYELRFLAAVDSIQSGAAQGARIQLGTSFVRSFAVRHRSVHLFPSFQEHVYHVVAAEGQTDFVFETLPLHGDQRAVLVASFSLLPCGSSSEDGEAEAVYVDAAYVGSASSLTARWLVADEESGLRETLWAIGTSRGGAQIQDFAPVGRQSMAKAACLNIAHNASLYITVVVQNSVGAFVRLNSPSVRVDKTAPLVSVTAPAAIGLSAEGRLQVSWTARDDESGVTGCKLGVSSLADGSEADVIEEMDVDVERGIGAASHGDIVLRLNRDVLISGTRIYTFLRCSNSARLTVRSTAGGTALLLVPPSAEAATVQIISQGASANAVHGAVAGMQASLDTLHVTWGGYVAAASETILDYSVTVEGDGLPSSGIRRNSEARRDMTLSQLALRNGAKYTVSVMAYDEAGQQSGIAHAFVVADTTAPLARPSGICVVRGTAVLTLRWADAFVEDACPPQVVPELNSETCLQYELSMGLVNAGATVVRREILSATEVSVPAERLSRDTQGEIDYSIAYRVHVEASNGVGLSASVSVALLDVRACV